MFGNFMVNFVLLPSANTDFGNLKMFFLNHHDRLMHTVIVALYRNCFLFVNSPLKTTLDIWFICRSWLKSVLISRAISTGVIIMVIVLLILFGMAPNVHISKLYRTLPACCLVWVIRVYALVSGQPEMSSCIVN